MNDFGIAVGFLRLLRGWSREQLARAAALDVASIARHEQGGRPRRRTVERVRQAFGLSLVSWQRLLDLIADLSREMAANSPAVPASGTEPIEDLLAALAPRVFGAFASLSIVSAKTPPPPLPNVDDRTRANQLWARLRPLSMAARRALIAEGEEFSCWALAERLSLESDKIAPDRASEALALAGMADRIAEKAPMPPKFRDLLRSLTAATLGNARRYAGHLPGAEVAFRRSDELWKSGAGGDPRGLLDGSRRIGLRAASGSGALHRFG
ncbi:MAG TPA: helix-turn-helix transcriptional regulator [Thermoanaerobaculia bacterium]|jgi:transcriptional regulator with XRE-family HTH domain|nr:helix-turn-helix transcriptional regulator [Thermoanaerobaculia bacterium]